MLFLLMAAIYPTALYPILLTLLYISVDGDYHWAL